MASISICRRGAVSGALERAGEAQASELTGGVKLLPKEAPRRYRAGSLVAPCLET